MMSTTYSVLVIGGGFGGLIAAHHLLKNVLPSLEQTGRNYEVTILTPVSKFFHRISAPRALINPHLQNLDAGLKDIAPGLEQYGSRSKLVIGRATAIDATKQAVDYEGTEGNSSGSVTYDSLIIASGADDDSAYWGVTVGAEKLRAAYEDIQNRIEGAKTILIAGGGPVGVETAGEVVDRFPGMKDVTLLSGTTQVLAGIKNKRFGQDAQSKLTKKGVKVVHQVRVSGTTRNADLTTTVKLDNGEERTVDIYIPSSGLKPNSGFVPAGWLNENQRVKCDPGTFRLDVPDVTNVYAFGSVASYSDGTLFDVKFAYKVLGETFKEDQLSSTNSQQPKGGRYSKWQYSDVQFTPIGRADGVCIVKGWRLPWFLCVLIKSRTYFVDQTPEYTEGKGV